MQQVNLADLRGYESGTHEYFEAKSAFLDSVASIRPANGGGCDFMKLVRQYQADHGCDLSEAMKAIVRLNPAAHAQYIARRPAR